MKGNVFKQAFWSIWFVFGMFTQGNGEGCRVGWWLGEAEGVLQGLSLVAYKMYFDTRSIPTSLLFFGLYCQ